MNDSPDLFELVPTHDRDAFMRLLFECADELRPHVVRGRQSAGAPPRHELETTLLFDAVCERLASQRSALRDEGQLAGLVRLLARRLTLDAMRRTGIERRALDAHLDQRADAPPRDVWSGDGAASTLMHRERLERVARAVDELAEIDESLAAIVILRIHGDLTHPRVASLLGMTRRRVEENWLRAKAFLSDRLRETIHDQPRS